MLERQTAPSGRRAGGPGRGDRRSSAPPPPRARGHVAGRRRWRDRDDGSLRRRRSSICRRLAAESHAGAADRRRAPPARRRHAGASPRRSAPIRWRGPPVAARTTSCCWPASPRRSRGCSAAWPRRTGSHLTPIGEVTAGGGVRLALARARGDGGARASSTSPRGRPPVEPARDRQRPAPATLALRPGRLLGPAHRRRGGLLLPRPRTPQAHDRPAFRERRLAAPDRAPARSPGHPGGRHHADQHRRRRGGRPPRRSAGRLALRPDPRDARHGHRAHDLRRGPADDAGGEVPGAVPGRGRPAGGVAGEGAEPRARGAR